MVERFAAPVRFRGTFAPFSRASLSPIAMACLRLFTVPPEPLLSVPFLRRCIADFTDFDAERPYLAMEAPFQLTVTAATATTSPNRSRVRLLFEQRATRNRRSAQITTATAS